MFDNHDCLNHTKWLKQASQMRAIVRKLAIAGSRWPGLRPPGTARCKQHTMYAAPCHDDPLPAPDLLRHLERTEPKVTTRRIISICCSLDCEVILGLSLFLRRPTDQRWRRGNRCGERLNIIYRFKHSLQRS